MSNSSLFDLHGKTAVVTGGAGILGRAFCKALADSGATVIVLDINQEAAQETAQHIGAMAHGYALDVTDEASVEHAVAHIVTHHGTIDIWHNNAATKPKELTSFFEDFEQFSLDVWHEVMRVNIDGMFLCAKHIGRHMKEHRIQGSIIQTASIYGILGPDQRIYEGSEYHGMPINSPAVYSASKGAVVALTKYLAAYWGKDGIRVNTLTPGGVASGQNTRFQEQYAHRIPLQRMAEARDMVGGLVFLASDASRYITGHNLVIDGGLSCW